MAKQLFIDIRAFAHGSQRINYEKSEINLILNFLKPYFLDLAHRELERKRREIGLRSQILQIPTVFEVADAKGNSLEFNLACYGHGAEELFALTFTESSEAGREYKIAGNANNGSAEQLPVEHVGTCHGLLTPLMAKIAEMYPEEFSNRLQVFYDAAERFWHTPLR